MRNRSFLLIWMIYLFCSCGTFEESSNELVQESLNGSGKKALLFIKYGGATVANSLQISIVPDIDTIDSKATGNIFIADDSTRSIGKEDVKILWRHSDTLEVSYNNRLRVFKSEQQIMGVRVLYKQVE